MATLLGIALVGFALLLAAGAPGDQDGDGDVDSDDVQLVVDDKDTPVPPGNPIRDVDGDGTITVLDARLLATMCTRLTCTRQEDLDPATPGPTPTMAPTSTGTLEAGHGTTPHCDAWADRHDYADWHGDARSGTGYPNRHRSRDAGTHTDGGSHQHRDPGGRPWDDHASADRYSDGRAQPQRHPDGGR